MTSTILFLTLLGEASAAKPLEPGEFANTAWTTEKGAFVLHPLLLPSQYGLTDRIDLKFNVLSLLLETSDAASIEFGILQNDRLAVSLEGGLGYGARSSRTSGSAIAHVSAGPWLWWFDASAGVGWWVERSELSLAAPIELGWTRRLSERSLIRTAGGFDATDPRWGRVQGAWNYRFSNTGGLGLGAGAVFGDSPLLASWTEVFDGPPPALVPYPVLELWWKL